MPSTGWHSRPILQPWKIRAIRERLHHIHLVQLHFFGWWRPQTRKFAITKVEDYSNLADLKAFARKVSLRNVGDTEGDLSRREAGKRSIEVPWFQPPLKISVRQH